MEIDTGNCGTWIDLRLIAEKIVLLPRVPLMQRR